MTENQALLTALRAAMRRWQDDASHVDYRTARMPWAILSPNEMAALKQFWPKTKGVEGNSILPNVLQAAIKQLTKTNQPER